MPKPHATSPIAVQRVFAQQLLTLQHPAVLFTLGELCTDIAGGTYPKEWALTAVDLQRVRQFAEALLCLVEHEAELEPIETIGEPQ